MSEYRLFAQRVGAIGVANILLILSMIILLPILTKTLPVEDYGIWVQMIVTIELIPSMVLLGLPYAMVRFLAGEKEKEEIREGFYSIYFFSLFASLVAALIFFSSSGLIGNLLFNNNENIVKILSIILFIECLNNIQYNYFRTFQRIKKYTSLVFIQIFLNLALVSYFVLSGYGIIGAALGILITRLSVFLIMTSFIISEIGIKVPKFNNMNKYLVFALPTVPGSLSSWLVNSSDRYVIGILLGAAFVGYYSPGYTLGNVINIFVAPIGLILFPILSKYYDIDKISEAKIILKYSWKYFLLLAIPSAFGLSLLSKPFLEILTTAEIAREGYLITPFVAFGTVFFGASVIITQIIILEKRTVITGSIYTLAAAINLGVNLALIPNIGIMGAAIATMVAYLFIFVAGAHYSFRYLKFDIDLRFISKSIVASMLMSILILIYTPEGLSDVLMTVGVCAVFYIGTLLILRGISDDEIAFFKTAFRA